VIVKTGRFGSIEAGDSEIIRVPLGILGLAESKRFCLVDPGDDTLILWLQSIDQPEIAIPVLEPKIFKPDYAVRLSAAELRELELENINQSAVFSILTIGEDATQMTGNLRAPLVINLKKQIGRQVVLQENEYSLRHPMFKELRMHLMTIAAQKKTTASDSTGEIRGPIRISDIPPSLTVRSLTA
jgi:flagellar assembly factor FliW